LFTEAFYTLARASEQLLNALQEYPFLPTPHGLYHQSRAILDSDTSDRLADISHPTLVVVGRKIWLRVKFSEQLAQGIPNAELVILDRGGHAFVVESAETVVKECSIS